jgi:hypothetical protein
MRGDPWGREGKVKFSLVIGLQASFSAAHGRLEQTHGALVAGKVFLRCDNLVYQIQDPAQQVNLGRLQDEDQVAKGVVCHDLALLWGGMSVFSFILNNLFVSATLPNPGWISCISPPHAARAPASEACRWCT